MKSPFRNGILLALLILALDQATKWYILSEMRLGEREPMIVTGFFKLVMVWNRGISFGMLNSLPGGQLLLSALAVAVVSLLIWWLREARNWLMVAGIGLIIGGAVGNLIDRLRFGAVADFLYFHIADYYWPAFNVADAAICIGAALIIIENVTAKKT